MEQKLCTCQYDQARQFIDERGLVHSRDCQAMSEREKQELVDEKIRAETNQQI